MRRFETLSALFRATESTQFTQITKGVIGRRNSDACKNSSVDVLPTDRAGPRPLLQVGADGLLEQRPDVVAHRRVVRQRQYARTLRGLPEDYPAGAASVLDD